MRGIVRQASFTLGAVPPFRLDLTTWAIRRRASNAVDLWDGHTYRRAIVVSDRAVDVQVVQSGATTVEVTVRGPSLPASTRASATAVVERMLGLRTSLTAFHRMAQKDPHLGPLAAHFRGLKPPRFPSVFEALVNGIACQQLSLSVGIVLLNRLAERCGLSVNGLRAFPRSSDLAALRPNDLRKLGFSSNKAIALLGLARRVESGLDLEALSALDDDAVIDQLLELRGVGRWTAEYTLLRGLGRLERFPGDDVGARTNLSRWMKLRRPLDYDRVRRLSRRWHPYAGFLYFHLLLQSLEEAGVLDVNATAAAA